ncbi:MAG: metallophosphoesterase, partial [Spirochaetales bacterium]|nr:metallophosphoesterase [Spirochaetales bacterium]
PFIVLGGLCYAISVVALLVVAGVAWYIVSNAYGPAGFDARPVLVNPARGIEAGTSPDRTYTLRVALSSDPHYGRDVSDAVARSAILRLSQAEYEAGKLDAFFNLGDTVEMGMNADDWREALESMRADAPTLPFVVLLGNHDALIGGVNRWRNAFAAGDGPQGIPQGGLTASSWRMDVGTIHFIALDLLWGPEGFGATEKAWLAKQLASIPADDYTVILSHCFFYSSGYTDEETGKAWYDHADMLREVAPLIAGRADLVVSGHNHYMEWIEADGTAWAVVGAMGGKPDPVPTYTSPGRVWFSQGRYGRLVLELRAAELACEFQDHTGTPLYRTTLAP